MAEIEDGLRVPPPGLPLLREQAGFSQREVAKLIGVSQTRVAAVEHSLKVTIEMLDQYVNAVGGTLEVNESKARATLPSSASPP